MKQMLLALIGAANYLKLRHSYLLFISNRLPGTWQVYYSQMGEDMILNNLFQNKNEGFFVDIGAYHPVELSNTYYFYKKGWRGINIDATPGSMEKFKCLRPADINLELGVAGEEGEMNYYLFHNKALNTFSENGLRYAKEQFNLEPFKIVKRKFMPLDKILDKYLPAPVTKIDFLSIDVEGADELVLRSNNFKKYRPQVICIEMHVGYSDFMQTTLCKFLEGLNYHFAAKSGPSYFYYLND